MKRKFIIRNDLDKSRLAERVLNYKGEKPLQVEVSEYQKKRSLDQNALYWVWLHEISKHIHEATGQWYSDEELHDFFKAKYLPSKPVEIKGEIKTAHKSTTRLTVQEMSDYLMHIEVYCADDLGLILPKEDAA